MKKRKAGRHIRTPIFVTIVCIFISGCTVYNDRAPQTTGTPPPPPPPPTPVPMPMPMPMPMPTIPPSIPALVDATRIFTSSEMYPPSSFAAYGIVAFKSLAMRSDIDRHLMICEAYTAVLPHAGESDVQQSEQLVTVWPVKDRNYAILLNNPPQRLDVCHRAVANYDLITARKAHRDATQAGAKLAGNGPYLLAWSPSRQKGQSDALVLVADLTTVTTPEQARSVFNAWRDDIERDPQLWKNGWDLNRVRLKIQQWADLYGKRIITMFIQ